MKGLVVLWNSQKNRIYVTELEKGNYKHVSEEGTSLGKSRESMSINGHMSLLV
jgi:hypothetical protein